MGAPLLMRLCLVLLSVVLFSNTLGNPFVAYDDQIIVTNPGMAAWLSPDGLRETFVDFSRPARIRHGSEYLPVRDLSAALQYRWFGRNPVPYHIVQLVLFSLVSLLLFELFLRMGAAREVAFSGTLIFVVHPIHVESVAWISGHKDLLSLMFLLLTFLAYLQRYWFAALLAFVFGLGSKYPVLLAPVWLPFLDLSVARRFEWRRWVPFLVLALLAYFLFTHVRTIAGNTSLEIVGTLGDWLRNLPVVLDSIISRFLCPFHLQIHYPYVAAASWWDSRVLRGLAQLTLVIFLAVFFRNRRPTLSFAVALLLIGSTPMFQTNQTNFLADRYLLFPSIGLALLLGTGLQVLGPAWLRRSVLALLAAGFSLLTLAQNRVWSSDLALWENAAHGALPVEPVVWHRLAVLHSERKDWDSVARCSHNYLSSPYPDEGLLRTHLLLLPYSLLRMNRWAEAEESYLRALKRYPGECSAHLNLGIARLRQGKLRGAMESFEMAARLDSKRLPPKIQTFLSDRSRQP